jgi:hypothetical protein
MLAKNYVDFTDSFLTKEQEDYISKFAKVLLNLEKTDKIHSVFEILIEILIKSPKFVKFFLEVLENQDILSEKEIKTILKTAELLVYLKFPIILLNSLKKGSLQPGSQKIVFSSIESFGRRIITKINQSAEERANITNKFKDMSEDIKDSKIVFFSYERIKQKSLDYFYKGIKAFRLGKYRAAYNRFLEAIRLYRDDLFYYWNLAKVLSKLELEDQAVKFYKFTLRFLRLKRFQYKDEIKLEIKEELHWVKTKQGTTPKFEPIISIERYQKKN